MKRGVFGFLGLGATTGRTSDLLNPAAWLSDSVLGRATSSGARVSTESANAISTYFACARNIAEDLGALPAQLKRRTGRRLDVVDDHPVAELLEHPNEESSWQAVVEVLLGWALGWGNGRAEIQRGADGLTPVALWPIHPSRISTHRATGNGPPHEPAGLKKDELWYLVRGNPGQPDVGLHARDVFDLHGYGPDGINGYSIARQAAEDLGIAQSGREFEARIYSSGATTRGVLETDKMLDAGVLKRLRRQWADTYAGAESTGKPIILEKGMTYKAVSINPRDAQFLESMTESAYTICRWFRMPPHKVGLLQRATWNNIEAQEIEYVVDVLTTWAVRIEKEARKKLLRPDEIKRRELYVLVKLQGRLRGDYNSRTQGYERLVRSGIYTPNECRLFEDENPSPHHGADELWMQSQMQPIELLARPKPAPVQLQRPGLDVPPAGPDRDRIPNEDPDAPDDPQAPAAPEAPADPADPGTTSGPRAALAAALSVDDPEAGVRALAARRAELGADVETLRPTIRETAVRIAARHGKVLERWAGLTVGQVDAKLATFVAGEPPHVAEILRPTVATIAAAARRRGWTLPADWTEARSSAIAAAILAELSGRVTGRGAAAAGLGLDELEAGILADLDRNLAELHR